MTLINSDDVLKITNKHIRRLKLWTAYDTSEEFAYEIDNFEREVKQLTNKQSGVNANQSQGFSNNKPVVSLDKQGSTDKTSDKVVLCSTGNPVSNIPVCKCGHNWIHHNEKEGCIYFESKSCLCNKFQSSQEVKA